ACTDEHRYEQGKRCDLLQCGLVRLHDVDGERGRHQQHYQPQRTCADQAEHTDGDVVVHDRTGTGLTGHVLGVGRLDDLECVVEGQQPYETRSEEHTSELQSRFEL